jgi:magnesium transporter
MEIDEEYIDKVKSFIEQKDAENVKALLIDLHPADIAELCNDLPKRHASFTVSSTTKQPPTYW